MSLFSIFTKTLKISFYYSYKDEKLRKKLVTQLSSLEQKNGVKIEWQKCQSVTGRNWKHENYAFLNTDHLIVLLVSPDFMALDDGWDIGRRAMKLYDSGKAPVIPVKLRQIDNWEATPFKDLQYLPSNGEPVDSKFWINHNEACVDIAKGIRSRVEELEQKQRQRQFTRAEQQAAIFAPINSFISSQFFQRIIRYPNISTCSVPIAAGVLVLAGFLGFYKLSLKNQAESFLNQGNQKSEKRDYQKNQAKSLFNQGKKKSGNREYLGAVKDYNQAIKIDQNYTDAYIGRGDAHYFLKDYEAAIEDYTQAIRLDPEFADAYMIRAIAHCELRDKQGAIKDDREAATLYAKQGATARHKKFLKRLKCIDTVSYAPPIKLNKQYGSLLN